jgi:hypothetical protein
MSAIGKSYAQLMPRAKYLLALPGPPTAYFEPLGNSNITSVMLETDFQSATGQEVGVNGTLYFDLGKIVTTYDANGNRVAVYRLANYVENSATEGVGSHPPFYIRTWGADPSSYVVTVARIA